MKNLLLLFLVPALIGISAAWWVNHSLYGYRDAKFGQFGVDETVTAANLAEYVVIEADASKKVGEIQLDGEPLFDFGVMAPGKEGQHVFTVRNVGDGPLALRVGASTCKCTLGELKKTALEPGEETEITLTWTPKAGEAKFNQKAQLISNDPKNPAISLEIVGKVVSDFEMSPSVWTFGQVAEGEAFEITGEIYNFSDHKIEPTTLEFSSDELNEHAEIDVQRIPLEEIDEGRQDAVEGFRVTAKIQSGIAQGSISQNLLFNYKLADRVKPESEGEPDKLANTKIEGKDWQLPVAVKGRVVGTLRMIESSKLKLRASGGYLLRMGKLRRSDKLTAKVFVMLKGPQREKTKLSVGDMLPEGVLEASLGEPKSRGKMVLYPLTIKLVPGEKSIERLGKNQEDFGKVTILSDNTLVSKMEIMVTFALELH